MSGHEDDHAEYGLVMPLVVCSDQGGPYDASAFVAGIRYAQLDAILALDGYTRQIGHTLNQGEPIHHVIETELMPQVDLLAMHRGFVVEFAPWDEDPSWTFATFSRPEPDVQPDP